MRIMDRERSDAYWRRVAVEETGLKPGTYRMRRHRGMDPKEAATRPPRPTTPVMRNPNSATSVAEAYGLNRNSIYDYKKRHKGTSLTFEEIAQKLVEAKEKKAEKQRFNQRCREQGKCPRTVRGWMEKYGFTEEQALNHRKKSRSEAGKKGRRAAREARIQAGYDA